MPNEKKIKARIVELPSCFLLTECRDRFLMKWGFLHIH